MNKVENTKVNTTNFNLLPCFPLMDDPVSVKNKKEAVLGLKKDECL